MAVHLKDSTRSRIGVLLAQGVPGKEIARMCGVSAVTVSKIKNQVREHLTTVRVDALANQTSSDLSSSIKIGGIALINSFAKAALVVNDEDFIRRNPNGYVAIATMLTQTYRDHLSKFVEQEPTDHPASDQVESVE